MPMRALISILSRNKRTSMIALVLLAMLALVVLWTARRIGQSPRGSPQQTSSQTAPPTSAGLERKIDRLESLT